MRTVMRRITSALLAVMMVLTFMPAMAMAADGDTSDAHTWGFGSSGKELSAGTYSLPVDLMKEYDLSARSMAAGCVNAAKLIVSEDGSARIRLLTGLVDQYGLTSGSKEWKIFTKISGTKDWAARSRNTELQETADAAVEQTAVYTDTTGTEKQYDQIVSFDVPDITWDGMYVTMWVDAMQSSPEAYLKLNYKGARASETADFTEVETVTEYTGTARVNQFGKYNVDTKVSVKAGKISALEISGSDFGGTYADVNKSKLQSAIGGIRDKLIGMSADQKDAKDIYNIVRTDAVTGATVSSETIGDSVMNALGMTYQPEVINVPSSVAAGIYEVPVSYYTDAVKHQLTGAEKSAAKMTVNADGTMLMDIDTVSGTKKEPLYLLDINGYYVENNRSKGLTVSGMNITKAACDYEDQYFAEGTGTVTHVTLPLTGGLAKEYATSATLYVPAMNNLNGEAGGLYFENGVFTVDAFVKVYWDEIVKTGDIKAAQTSTQPAADKPAVSQGDTCAIDGSELIVTAAATDGTVGTVTFTKAVNSNKVSVPDSVTLADGMTYNITAIGARAFTGGKIRTVTVGRNVTKLSKNAFAKSKVTKVILKTSGLKKSSVKGTFRGSKVKTVQVKAGSKKVNKKLVKKYKKFFTKKNAGRKVSVK